MTHGQLYQLLKKTKIPVRYDHFDYEVKPPYLCFWSTGRSYILADDKAYIKLHDYEIGLYVKEKNPELEEKIEKLLDSAELVYQTNETYISEQDVYVITYSIQI